MESKIKKKTNEIIKKYAKKWGGRLVGNEKKKIFFSSLKPAAMFPGFIFHFALIIFFAL